MKIRTGFVSNSSSSSFMTAIGVVKDWDKFNDWRCSVKSESYGIEIILIDIDADKKQKWPILYHNNSEIISYEAPTNERTFVTINRDDYKNVKRDVPINIEAKNLLVEKGYNDIVVYCVSNDEGDSDFYNPETEELDYDKVDFNWFSKDQQQAYNEFNEDNGIVLVDKIFGAGRNG